MTNNFTGPLVKNVNGYVHLVGIVSSDVNTNCSYTKDTPDGRQNRQRYANVPHYTQWIKYAFTTVLKFFNSEKEFKM